MTTKQTGPNLVLLLVACVIALAGSGYGALADEPQSHYALVQNALEKHVIPHIETLAVAAAPLPAGVASVCERGSDGAREELGGQFRKAVEAWAGVEFLRFGPLNENGRRERMSFWPDPRGVMSRQLRQLIASKDEAVLDAGAIAKQSAAVQGLPALEVLLTDKELPLGPGEASAYRCKLAQAIAANIAATSHELSDAWTKSGGWKDKMLRPGSDNETYKEPAEAASELIKALLVGLQLVGDVQVKPRLDAENKLPGPFEKSGLSKLYYTASVASLQDLYDAMALESYLPEDKDWVKNWAGGAWRTMLASDGTGGPASGARGETGPALRALHDKISGLRKLVSSEMSTAAGLTIGFNELDGD